MRERIKNLRDIILYDRDKFADNDAFNIRKRDSYYTIKFAQFADDVLSLAASFITRGYTGKQIAVVGENSYHYVVSYMAAVSAGATIVPLDRELQSSEIAGLVRKSESVALIYSNSYSYHYEDIPEEYEGIDCYTIGKAFVSGHTSLDTLIEEGSADKKDGYARVMNVELKPNDMCCIVFTSGTTGVSKGVMLSHHNIITDCFACNDLLVFGGNRFSLLPMHHTYEFNCGVVYSLMIGCTQSINHSLKYVTQNIQMFKPTDLLLVPLVAETMYNGIWNNIKQSGKEKMVRRMISITRFLNKIGIDVRKKVFKQIHDALGGNVEQIFCGGAHVDKAMACGFIDFGFKLYVGYGITECAPLITGNLSLKHKLMGSCGVPISCCDVRIAQSDLEDAEIEVKGTNVMLGYYKNEEATRAVMTPDGWYRTGDVGHKDKDGNIYITGRIKNIIVLKNGKNIYPEELEGYLYGISYVKEVLVYAEEAVAGEELQLCAEVFMNEENLQLDNISDGQSVIRAEIEKINSQNSYYKRITKIEFRDTEFDKTTSKKIKRKN